MGERDRKVAPKRRIWIGLLLLVLISGIYLYANRWGSTPPFRDESGAIIKGSVAEMKRLRLSGVEQSVLIRGKNTSAPILIWLHGGPGQDETGLFRRNNAALEDHFLVVYWVQRGTGRSWSADIPVKTMRRAQFVADLDELADYLRNRFKQDRVVLAGHSWGTSIGVDYAQKHPEKLAAYVGVGQVVNNDEGERRSYAFTLTEAKRRGDKDALAELTAIGPPPYPFSSLLVERKWLNDFGGGWRKPRSLLSLMWESFGASEMTLLDGLYFMRGQDFSSPPLQEDINGTNWMRDAPRFAMPVFIAAGRYDMNTPVSLQREYFDMLSAPEKHFKWFEQSAHSPPFEEPDAFNAFMITEVLPVVVKAHSTATATQ